MLGIKTKAQNIVRALLLGVSLMMTVSIALAEGDKSLSSDNNKQELVSNPDIPEEEMTEGLKEYYEKYADYELEFPLKTVVDLDPGYTRDGGVRDVHSMVLYNGVVYEKIKKYHEITIIDVALPLDGLYTKVSKNGSKVEFYIKNGNLIDFKLLVSSKDFLNNEMKDEKQCLASLHFAYFKRAKELSMNKESYSKFLNSEIWTKKAGADQKKYELNPMVIFKMNQENFYRVVNPHGGEKLAAIDDGIYIPSNEENLEYLRAEIKKDIINVKNCIIVN